MRVKRQLNTIRTLIDSFDKKNDQISAVTIGWQLDHTLKVINGVCYSVILSDPKAYKWDFNANRLWIFNIKKIPRGKAKAPKKVIASGEVTKNDLLKQLEKAIKLFDRLIKQENNAFFTHHVFGNLNLSNSIKFIEIHTDHHLKIAKEILAKE